MTRPPSPLEGVAESHMKNISTFKLNRLDVSLLAIIGLLVIWFLSRADLGVHYTWHWQRALEFLFHTSADGGIPYFFQGVLTTIRLSLWGILLALTLGVLLGVAVFSNQSWLKIPANLLIQLMRNIPPLVFVFIFYFFISNQLIPLLGLDEVLRNHSGDAHFIQSFLFGPSQLWENLFSGVLCVGLLSSAYIAEVIRSGLESIDQGQWEAADSLGLSTWCKYRYVIAPQVMHLIAPMIAGQSISLVKDTSIVSLISIQEMTFVGTEIANSSGYIFEIWIIVALTYFMICFSLSCLFRKIENSA